jgi:hypothetical protein
VGEVVPGRQRVGVCVAQHPLAVGEGRLEQRDRLAHPTRRPVSGGQVVQRYQRAGVGRAQHPLTVGEQRASDVDRQADGIAEFVQPGKRRSPQ